MSQHRGRRRARRAVVSACAVAIAIAAIAEAAGPETIDAPAAVIQPAQVTFRSIDAVTVFQTGELTIPVRDAALAAAQDANAPAAVGSGFGAGLIRVRRGTTPIYQSRGTGWAFPVSVSAMSLEAIGAVMGRNVSGPIANGQIVLAQSSAQLRGALVGDTIDFRTSTGSVASFVIGGIVPDAQVGGTEVIMSSPQADVLFGGTALATRVLIYGPPSRSALDAALAGRGLTTNSKVRIRRTWDPADPDNTLGMLSTKLLLGEFDIDYANLSLSGWTAMSPQWMAANLPSGRRSYPTGVLARCHNRVHADLTAALQEVVNSGLAGAIDVTNTNTYGGCSAGQARFSRITGNLGSVSRHSWGQPIDMNTVTNCQGCVPKMDCRVVRIFRKHNFAWGGNFLTSDGMHFEWVGTPRHTYSYPSKYCPNTATSSPGSSPNGVADGGQLPAPPEIGLAGLFVDDGLAAENTD